MEKIKIISNELNELIFKILAPAFAALIISISVQIQNKKANLINIICSVAIGISCAYLSGNFILNHFSDDLAPLAIALVTITGEKVGYWFVIVFNFSKIGDGLIKLILKKIK